MLSRNCHCRVSQISVLIDKHPIATFLSPRPLRVPLAPQVDSILLMINHALSNQLDWGELETRLTEARAQGDSLAIHVTQLNLQYNQITIRLSDPFVHSSESDRPDSEKERSSEGYASGIDVVVDLDLNALNNARKYYDKKRAAVKKEEKTLVASRKALKSAAFKAEQMRKDVKTLVQIAKVRKPMWFEKFFWFISSENYLVVAGRDALQNEALVKRYLGPDDIYVHADLHGASSVIIKARPLLPEEAVSESSKLAFQFLFDFPLWCIFALSLGPALGSARLRPFPDLLNDEVRRAPPEEGKDKRSVGEPGCVRSIARGQVILRFIPINISLSGVECADPAPTAPPVIPIPPQKTLTEAGTMAIVLSSAWNARVVTSAWWVRADQVSKTAPSGEYLNTGAFMIRGRKNYLPMSNFFYGFGILFKNIQWLMGKIISTRGKPKPAQTKTGAKHVGSAKTASRNAETGKSLSKRNKPPGQTNTGDKSTAHSDPVLNGTLKNKPLKRGQKSKLKKIKQKYGEQDEDERQIRMALLQGEGAKLSQHHQRLLSDREYAADMKTATDSQMPAESEESSHSDPESGNEPSNSGRGSTDDPPPQSPNADSEEAEDEEANDALPSAVGAADSDGDDDDVALSVRPDHSRPTDNNWLHLMDTFTGKPIEDDVLLYALPVCAPYSALSSYKFKVKLTPGNAKRGKGECLPIFACAPSIAGFRLLLIGFRILLRFFFKLYTGV
ncbi:unnamed protein product [Echinostoma caproni]|uniref:NFACT-R_1 domain-containing protein n=1 Tax=Echinostoma caproni TaxID=27848 RepID=A0A183AHZ9_9TREM|nr:unnamed protein product [Echinostoma caproni]